MNKLEVGMYARFDGKIGKVFKICKCEQCEARGYYEPIIEYAHDERDYVSVYWKDNLKASDNIIDLIEVGDYVNGSKVIEVDFDVEEEKYIRIDKAQDGLKTILRNNDIKSIVTKEQFESISYKVGE